MKMIVLAAILIVLAGCATTGSSQVAEAAKEYQTVTRSMSRSEVYDMLGMPHATLPDGREHWRVAYGSKVAELWVRFEPDGGISEIERHSAMD